jgi:hypothetical protein
MQLLQSLFYAVTAVCCKRCFKARVVKDFTDGSGFGSYVCKDGLFFRYMVFCFIVLVRLLAMAFVENSMVVLFSTQNVLDGVVFFCLIESTNRVCLRSVG